MLCAAELDMANTVATSDIEMFLTDAACAICSTYHTVHKASPRAAIFGKGHVVWHALPCWLEQSWSPWADQNTLCKNHTKTVWDCKVGDKVLLRKNGILHKSESWYESDPWTVTSIYRTMRVHCGTQSERFNIRRVIPF